MRLDLSLSLGSVACLAPGGVAAPTPGNELWVQPTFDASTGITLNGWTISGGEATAPASAAQMTATALETLTVGSYQVQLDISANPDGTQIGVTIASGGSANFGPATGLQTKTVTVSSVIDQLIKVRDSDLGDGGGDKITFLSVKKLS